LEEVVVLEEDRVTIHVSLDHNPTTSLEDLAVEEPEELQEIQEIQEQQTRVVELEEVEVVVEHLEDPVLWLLHILHYSL
jgi:hypothetical protein